MTTPRVLLLFPPPADCAQPYSSLPFLAAVLGARGCDTTVIDLNIEVMTGLVSAGEMARCSAALTSWMEAATEWPALPENAADRYVRSAGCLAFARVAPMASQEGLARLRQPDTYSSTGQFLRAARQIDRALQLSSVANYPAVISRFGLELPFDIWNSRSLGEAVECLFSTPLGAWLSSRVEELIHNARPHLVGISVVYPDQLVPSLILLRAIRAADPSIHTTIGGTTASRLAPKLDHMGHLLHLIDSVVTGDGETVLPELALRAVKRAPLNGLPGVLWRRPDNSLEYCSEMPAPLEAIPIPVHPKLDLDAYWTSEPVLLVSSSRSCYWSRCMFCDVSGSGSRPYRERSIESVVDELEILNRTTGARHFMFGDLAIKPQRLERLAAEIQRRSLRLYWSCQARLEAALTDDLLLQLGRAGCRGLVFGLESASQRVLSSMDKGTSATNFARILRGAHDAGIPVNVQAFIGFPGETEEEARQTCRFVLEHRESISSASITEFKLLEPSRAFRNASELGLSIRPVESADMDAIRAYESAGGLSPERAADLVRELGAEIRSAFPIMEAGLSWNAHALLLASRNGPDGLRVPAPAGGEARDTGIRLKPGLMMARLPYNVASVARRLKRNESGGGVTPRQPSWTVLDRDSARMITLDDRSHALLLRSMSGETGAALSEGDSISDALLLARMMQQNFVDAPLPLSRSGHEVSP